MDIIHSVAELRARLKGENAGIALVPTMGNLHEGHLQLVRIAKQHAQCVVVSIFVNRLQFGPREDFDQYPRTLAADCEKLKSVGANAVFAPDEKEMYPEAQTFAVEPSDIQNILEGAFRPGHFRGVATVVLKLFNMVAPTVAVFGKKDYQQYAVLNNMVQQFALPIKMIPAETTRADDGLALSSRNGYLSEKARAEAPRLYRTLSEIKNALNADAKSADYARLEQAGMETLAQYGWQPDYVVIRRQQDLQAPSEKDKVLVILAAARLGATRLIDNLEVTLSL